MHSSPFPPREEKRALGEGSEHGVLLWLRVRYIVRSRFICRKCKHGPISLYYVLNKSSLEKCHVLHHFKLHFSFATASGLIRDIIYFSYLQDTKNYPERTAFPYGAGTIAVLFTVEFSASITELGIQGARDTFHWMDK